MSVLIRDFWVIVAYLVAAGVALPACAYVMHKEAIKLASHLHKPVSGIIRPLSRVEQQTLFAKESIHSVSLLEPANYEPVIALAKPNIPLAALVAGLEQAESNLAEPLDPAIQTAGAPSVQGPGKQEVAAAAPPVTALADVVTARTDETSPSDDTHTFEVSAGPVEQTEPARADLIAGQPNLTVASKPKSKITSRAKPTAVKVAKAIASRGSVKIASAAKNPTRGKSKLAQLPLPVPPLRNIRVSETPGELMARGLFGRQS